MIAAAPEGSHPRRISNKQLKKTLPAVPQRGPEAGSIVYITIFMVFGANTSSCPFLHSPKSNTHNNIKQPISMIIR
jgi:hypothetical protein